MAVQDLWRGRDGKPTKRDGRGLRYRVSVTGYPSSSHRTKAEADYINAQRITAGPPVPGDLTTVGELVDVWLDGKRHLSRSGFTGCRLAAGRVKARWGSTPVADLDGAQVQAWLSGLDVGADSRRKASQCIVAATRGRVDLGRLRTGALQPREPRYLSAVELHRLASEAGPDGPMVMLLGSTGIRLGECCGLLVGDVDAERRRLRVRKSKTSMARDVPIPASVLALLDLTRPADAWLFPSPRGARTNERNWRERRFYPACERAGLVGVHPHDLRHTAASLAIAAGADVKAVQRMLGHETATMTLDRYGHLWDTGLDEVAARMDDVLAGTARVRTGGGRRASGLVRRIPGTGQRFRQIPADSTRRRGSGGRRRGV